MEKFNKPSPSEIEPPEVSTRVEAARQLARSIIPPPEALENVIALFGENSPISHDLRNIQEKSNGDPIVSIFLLEEWIWRNRPAFVGVIAALELPPPTRRAASDIQDVS